MGKKTKIDWCDSTWNPVTGCLHGCEYCYARKIAYRFGSVVFESNTENGYECDLYEGTFENHVLNYPALREWKSGRTTKAPYPFCFDPTFHRYLLDEPQHWKKPRTIFVCSMADLFGDWVPDEWIDSVIKATQQALQHRYLFLTKNPERYAEWLERFETSEISGLCEVNNCWFGASATNNAELERANRSKALWLSIEPIREHIYTDEDQFMEFRLYDGVELKRWEWVVIGAETGRHKNKVVPMRAWVQEIADCCKFWGTPVFMKESLRQIMGNDFRQEFPWEE